MRLNYSLSTKEQKMGLKNVSFKKNYLKVLKTVSYKLKSLSFIGSVNRFR